MWGEETALPNKLELDLKRYVPSREIHDYILIKSGKEPAHNLSKKDLVDLLFKYDADPLFEREVGNLVARFRHAGKGSYYWSYPPSDTPFDKSFLEYQMKEHAGEEIFQVENRVELTAEPKLTKAGWINKNTLKLDFAYKDKPFEIEVDYEIQEIVPTRRVSAFVRNFGNSTILEGRGDIRKAHKVFENIGKALGTSVNNIDITDDELESIKGCLGASKKGVKHKKNSGIFNTVDLEASLDVNDLDTEADYISGYGADETRRARYEFDYISTNGSTTKVSFYIITGNSGSHHGGVRFMTDVSEEVVEHVLSCIKSVKGI